MSLSLTPTTDRHERPPRPTRSKRNSLAAGRERDEALMSSPHTGMEHEGALDRATKEDLVVALQAKCIEAETLELRVHELQEQEKKCHSDKLEMGRILKDMQERSEEMFREQAQLEKDVEARDDLVDRLRSRLGMAERELKDCQRAALIQERAFETERTTFQAQEAHLNSRIRQLQSSSSRLPLPASSPSEDLQEDLDSLRVSHSTLLVQLDQLSTEVQDLRVEHTRLKEENEGWEYLVREKTLTNHLFQRERDSKSEADDQDLDAGGHRSMLDVLDEELELEMDHLHSDLDAQTPTIEDEPIFPRSAATSRQPSSRYQGVNASRKASTTSTAFSDPGTAGVQGLDLAAELGRATGTSTAEPSGTGVEEENKRLREEVKALQLYCSKILDRIIAQDGFEHVLNVDYKTRRMGRSASGRGNLLDVVKMMQGEGATVTPTDSVPASTPALAAREKPRPVSTLIRGSSEVSVPAQQTPIDDKTAKRAKRGFSLDLRSFGFGSPTAESKTQTPLKPLTLTPSPASQTPSRLPGRKLEPQAEDEDDRRERTRLEAALKLMGIDKSRPTPAASAAPPPERQTVKRSSSLMTSTPLSRLSSALGFSDTQLPPDPDPSPEKVDAALKEYDEKERARRKSLSAGRAEGGYTSPPRTVRRVTDLGPDRRDIDGDQIRQSGSISTLWSIGSSPKQDKA